MFPVAFDPRVRQLREILQGILHLPFSSFSPHLSYSNLYASALESAQVARPPHQFFAILKRGFHFVRQVVIFPSDLSQVYGAGWCHRLCSGGTFPSFAPNTPNYQPFHPNTPSPL